MEYLKKVIGEKCFLSPIDTSASKLVAKWSNDPDISIKTGDIADLITYEDQKKYLEQMTSSHGYGFYIVDNAKGGVIGVARLMRVNHTHKNALAGIFIGNQDDKNRGVGTEALSLLVDFGFNIINLKNIMVEVFSYNKPSLRMCEKVGFKTIGSRRKAISFGDIEFDEVFLDIVNEDFKSPYYKNIIDKLK